LQIDNVYLAELQKAHRLTQRIEFLENQSVIGDTITQAKESIWMEINEAITDIWPSIEIIFEQDELVQRAKEVIADVKKEFGLKPGKANTLIRVLNTKTKDELEEYNIEDRTKTILEVRRILTKENLMLQLENKCHNFESSNRRFHKKIFVLHKKDCLDLEQYQRKLYSIATDKSIFSKIKGTITSKAFMEGLIYDLFIKHEINHLFLVKPTFQKYTEVDETFRKLVKYTIPDEERWEELRKLMG